MYSFVSSSKGSKTLGVSIQHTGVLDPAERSDFGNLILPKEIPKPVCSFSSKTLVDPQGQDLLPQGWTHDQQTDQYGSPCGDQNRRGTYILADFG
jgi:hypothetical protein